VLNVVDIFLQIFDVCFKGSIVIWAIVDLVSFRKYAIWICGH